jgi:hypothetical protein
MSNENKTYTSLNDVKPLVNKVSSEDSSTLKNIFSNVVQLIRDKHL